MKDDPIKPTRALYLCNCEVKDCKKTACQVNCFHTTNVCYAKNGPVVNVREWDSRFEIVNINGLLYYVEKK